MKYGEETYTRFLIREGTTQRQFGSTKINCNIHHKHIYTATQFSICCWKKKKMKTERKTTKRKLLLGEKFSSAQESVYRSFTSFCGKSYVHIVVAHVFHRIRLLSSKHNPAFLPILFVHVFDADAYT